MGLRPSPLSPHLQVYRLPVAALLSIAHRFSGIVLTAGLFALVGLLLNAGSGPQRLDSLAPLLHSWPAQFAVKLWLLALACHTAHGVRHLFWDLGHGYAMHTVRQVDRIELAATVLLTAAFWWNVS